MATEQTNNKPADAPQPTPPLEDPDLLFAIFQLLEESTEKQQSDLIKWRHFNQGPPELVDTLRPPNFADVHAMAVDELEYELRRGGVEPTGALAECELRAEVERLRTQERHTLRAVLQTNHAWRAAALRPDLPFWARCDPASFLALAPPRGQSHPCEHRWTCEAVARLVAAKPRLQALDLSACSVSSAAAVARVIRALPPTLHTLALVQPCAQPDATLHALLQGLSALPRLRRLDLRGVLTERTLAGVRLLGRAEGKTAASLAVRMGALEALSVGFHLHSAVGRREGAELLAAQAALAQRLRYVGCLAAAETGWGGLGPVDVRCRCCGGLLYARLASYVLHPPQQGHISYELHTDEPPRAAAVAGDAEGDRLWCVRGCQGRLWLVDAGSRHVRHVLGRKYAVACGPPLGERPGLAMATPAAARQPAPGPSSGGTVDDEEDGGGAGRATPPDPEYEAFPPSIWSRAEARRAPQVHVVDGSSESE